MVNVVVEVDDEGKEDGLNSRTRASSSVPGPVPTAAAARAAAERVPPLATGLLQPYDGGTRVRASSNAFGAAAKLGGRTGAATQERPRVAPFADREESVEAPNVFDTVNTVTSNMSCSSHFATLEYSDMTKEERYEARQLMKDFVRTMVRGRPFVVEVGSGEERKCFCALSRKLDRLRISVGEGDKKVREVRLASIVEVTPSNAEGNGDSPCASLVLDTDQCITFRLDAFDERDALVACLTMLSSQAKLGAAPHASECTSDRF